MTYEPTTPAPGPYSWQSSGKPGGNGDFNYYLIDKNKRKIAAVWGKRGEKEATANLLMASHDLLEAAKHALEWMKAAATDPRMLQIRELEAAIELAEKGTVP